MTVLSAGELVGLPAGFPGRGLELAVYRYALLLLVAAWCALLARGRRRAALAVGAVGAMVSAGYWILALGRPWGVLVDPDATRLAAETAVAAVAPAAGSFVVGEPPGAPLVRGLLWMGIPARIVVVLPTLLPLITPTALAVAVGVLWRQRDRAWLAASLVLAASASELGIAAGWGLLPVSWARPAAAALLVVLVVASLALGRAPRRWGSFASAAVLLGAASTPGRVALAHLDAAAALTIEQGLWLPLALVGFRVGVDASTRGLVAAGAGMTMLGAVGLPFDAFVSLQLYRTGLVLAACTALWHATPRLEAALRSATPRLAGRLEPRSAVVAGVLAVTVPGSALVWWEAPRADSTTARSVVPFSQALEPSMSWIRANTPPDAVFLASPAYSPALCVRTGRRVLRADGLLVASDDAERVRAERPLLVRADRPERVKRYGVGWVFAAPGDFRARGIDAPEDLVGRPGLRLRYRDRNRFHIFEVIGGP